MKKILGLDIGTNSIGWALIENDFEEKEGNIIELGSRIIPMSQAELSNFDTGQSVSKTAERTGFRGTRRLYQRDNLRRDRLHRVLNILGFLPKHYAESIDFEKNFGQFKKGKETKINYKKNENGKYEFIFKDSFLEMVDDFKEKQPHLFHMNKKGKETKIPYDWTIYYLRKKALSAKISKEELAWLILNFNQKRGYYELREQEEEKTKEDKKVRKEFITATFEEIKDTGKKDRYGNRVLLTKIRSNLGNFYPRMLKKEIPNWIGLSKDMIISIDIDSKGDKIDDRGNISCRITVPKEDDHHLLKEKAQRSIDNHHSKMVGMYIYETLLQNPKQKIRGKLIRTIERDYYTKEFKKILEKQIGEHSELRDDNLYRKCIEELYPRNEAHQNNIKEKGFKYLFLEDIIFYQRPLKSKKSTIVNCQYETRFSLIDKYNFENLYNKLKLHSEKQINEFVNDICFVKDLKERNKKGKEITIKKDVTDEYLEYKKSAEFVSAFKNSQEDYQKLLKAINSKDIYITKYTETKLKGIPKSHPLFQEFRLWQFLKNLRIYKKEATYEIDITKDKFQTEDDWVELFEHLKTQKEVEQKNIITFLVKKKLIKKADKDDYRWNYVEDKKYPIYETRASFLSRLKKVAELNVNEFLTNDVEKQLWHIIYSVKDIEQYKKALKTFAKKNKVDEDSFVTAFEKYPTFKSDYGSYSEKALKKLLPLMRMGKYWSENEISKEVKNRISKIKERLVSIDYDEEVFNTDPQNKLQTITDDVIPKQLLKSFVEFKDKNHLKGLNTYQACYAVYERHSEASDIIKWETPKDINLFLENFKQHSLRNPIVEQIVMETLRTVRDIWQFYGNGEKDFFDEIHIELGREMKNDKKVREEISKRNIENENTNQRIKALLQELIDNGAKPFSQTHQEILKIYEEGVYQNLDVKYENVNEDDIVKIRKKASPTKADIQKYKLWLEQGYSSPYTGELIPLGKLFSTEYQIEHIIPQSRYFDNSLSNKVICESGINPNPYKDNQTGYEFINNQGGSIIPELSTNNKTVKLFTLEQYKNHCSRFFKKNKSKLKNLLSEDIPEGFIERQLNDTRYISKLIKGLLSNIVREENEREATSKNIVPVTGAITSKLKQDWGLNEKWNELVQPRFERLNMLTNSKDFGVWDYQKDENGKNLGKQFFRIQVPDEISKGFSKKRIDHRHHTLDALVIACTNRKHIHYLNSLNNDKIKHNLQPSLLIKNSNGHFTKQFLKPWKNFTNEIKNNLESIIVSFKQKNRVLTKASNRYWKWDPEKNKKELFTQKGSNRSIRKPLHAPLPYGKIKYKFSILEISKNIGKRELIHDDLIRQKIEKAFNENNNKIGDTERFLKNNPIKDENGKDIKFCVFNIPETRYRKRQPISKLSNRGQGGIKTTAQAISFINKISDRIIRDDLLCHLKKNSYDIDKAFSVDGIEDFNINRKIPVYKLPISEISTSKFPLGKSKNTKVKFGEAEGGTNLFFAIYWNEEEKKREYETIPLNEVIDHQKWRATLPKDEMKKEPMIPINQSKGMFLFSLSPNDLVYIPTDEEIEYPHIFDYENLSKEQIQRIYVVNDFSDYTIYFTQNTFAKAIAPKEADLNFDTSKNKLTGSFDNKTARFQGKSIKEICWKLKVDRLGNITNIYK